MTSSNNTIFYHFISTVTFLTCYQTFSPLTSLYPSVFLYLLQRCSKKQPCPSSLINIFLTPNYTFYSTQNYIQEIYKNIPQIQKQRIIKKFILFDESSTQNLQKIEQVMILQFMTHAFFLGKLY